MPTADTIAISPPSPIRAGGCAGCTLCCKVLGVESIAKPANAWCPHCKTGAGCGIYDVRPVECAAFVCGFLSLPSLGEEWRPLTSRLIIDTQSIAGATLVVVDPGRPDAWRRQPYYAALQSWARQGLPRQMRIIVRIGRRNIVILPDHAVDVGNVAPDEAIVTIAARAVRGADPAYQVYVAKKSAWASVGSDIVQGLRLPEAGDGFRSGLRLD